MKKNKLVALVLGLCFAVSLLSGCNNATDESAEVSRIGGGQTKINVDNGGSKKPAVGDYKFSYKGYEITLGERLGKYLEILGQPEDRKDGASCAHQGFDLEYYYPGFTIVCALENEADPDEEAIIDQIIIIDALVECNGIHIGQTINDAKTILGTPDEEYDRGIVYRSGETNLFVLHNEVGEIYQIEYRTAND